MNRILKLLFGIILLIIAILASGLAVMIVPEAIEAAGNDCGSTSFRLKLGYKSVSDCQILERIGIGTIALVCGTLPILTGWSGYYLISRKQVTLYGIASFFAALLLGGFVVSVPVTAQQLYKSNSVDCENPEHVVQEGYEDIEDCTASGVIDRIITGFLLLMFILFSLFFAAGIRIFLREHRQLVAQGTDQQSN